MEDGKLGWLTFHRSIEHFAAEAAEIPVLAGRAGAFEDVLAFFRGV